MIHSRVGPDHGFSMTPATWREMVLRARELEAALGDGIKRIEANEREAAVVQRRCLRLARDLPAGDRDRARAPDGAAPGARRVAAAVGDRAGRSAGALLRAPSAGAELRLADLAPASEAAA